MLYHGPQKILLKQIYACPLYSHAPHFAAAFEDTTLQCKNLLYSVILFWKHRNRGGLAQGREKQMPPGPATTMTVLNYVLHKRSPLSRTHVATVGRLAHGCACVWNPVGNSGTPACWYSHIFQLKLRLDWCNSGKQQPQQRFWELPGPKWVLEFCHEGKSAAMVCHQGGGER